MTSSIKGLPLERFSPCSGEVGAVLLETQVPDFRDRYSYLLRFPRKVLVAGAARDVPSLLEEAQEWQARGFLLAGFLSYEAGYGLEPPSAGGDGEESAPRGAGFPPAWFGVYDGALRFDHVLGRWTAIGLCPPGPFPGGGDAGVPPFEGPLDPVFSMEEAAYREKFGRIRDAIADGEVYQANLTGKFVFPFDGEPFALYMRLRAAQPVKYGAFLRTESGCIVSSSPELFFRRKGDRIETRPMKGTAPRGLTDAEDRRAAASLRSDPKNRAENVMIVDLLRNDLGRVCVPGSVQVPRLFAVERYRTVLQMVSTVVGTLRPGVTLASLFRALFPGGSVTGAPKIAAMRLLRELEGCPRGVYTGAIGILLPGGDMVFSLAIRTVSVKDGRAEAGAGGGIVWDSDPSSELGEVRLKGRYLDDPPPGFLLIETFLWTPASGFRFLADHLRRLYGSARYFGFPFRKEAVLESLQSAVRGCGDGCARKIRLLLERSGHVIAQASLLPPPGEPAARLRVRISNTTVSSRDPFVRHKTTNRAWRDEELRIATAEGFGEVLFLNERGELTEGAISNVILEIDGKLLTPPVACGLLDGICRRRILSTRGLRVEEKVLRPGDMEKASGILLANSVRGVRRAEFKFRHGA